MTKTVVASDRPALYFYGAAVAVEGTDRQRVVAGDMEDGPESGAAGVAEVAADCAAEKRC
jgi:hypothetical protein